MSFGALDALWLALALVLASLLNRLLLVVVFYLLVSLGSRKVKATVADLAPVPSPEPIRERVRARIREERHP